MIIKLVKSSADGIIHGTDNGKKTGCNINLLKFAGKFQESGTSEDILPITCEKCRIVLAKKIINENKKERKRLIKEEKLREKKGIVDENIVSLGGRHARPVDIPEPEPEPESEPIQNEKIQEENNYSYNSTVSNTDNPPILEKSSSPYMSADLAEFAIPAPAPQNEENQENEKISNINIQNNDDFLAQFTIPKPENDTYNDNIHQNTSSDNDFLSQFAINSSDEKDDFSDDTDDDIDFLSTPTISAEAAYDEMDSSDDDFDFLSPPPVSENSDDDFLSQFALPDTDSESTPEMNYSDYSDEQSNQDYQSYESASSPKEIINDEQWNNLADSLFSHKKLDENSDIPEMSSMNYSDSEEIPNIPDIPEISSMNYSDSEGIPDIPDIPEISSMNYSDSEEIPDIPDIPEISSMNYSDSEEIPDIPDIPEISSMDYSDSEEIPDISDIPEISSMNYSDSEEIPDIPDIPEISSMNYSDSEGIPDIPDIPEISSMNYSDSEEIPDTLEANPAETTTEENIASEDEDDEEMKKKKSMYQYTAPVFNDETNKSNIPPVQNSPFPAFMPNSQPQIMNIPQFVGYSPDGSPMYQYVPSQFMGYDANNQPIFIPIQMPVNNNPMTMNPQPMSVNSNPMTMNPQPMPINNNPMTMNPQPMPVNNNSMTMNPQPMPVNNNSMTMNPQPIPVNNNPMTMNPQPIPINNNPMTMNPQPVNNNPEPVKQQIPPVNNPATSAPVMPKSNINISYLANEPKKTPSAFANAIAESTKKKNSNLFDMQESTEMPTIITSIEEAVSQVSGQKIQKKTENKNDNISGLFEEYKGPSSSRRKNYSSSSSHKQENKTPEPQKPLTKAEQRAKKKQEKIDAKFKKDLAKRGF